MQLTNEIVIYQDKNVIITEVYTIVFDNSDTSTFAACGEMLSTLTINSQVLAKTS